MARKPSAAKSAETTAAEKPAPTPPAAENEGGTAWGAAPAASSINSTVLATIAAATAANSFAYVSEADYAPLVAAGYAEINPGIVDPNGAVATRATSQGMQYMTDNPAPVAAPVAPAAVVPPAQPDASVTNVDAPTAASVTAAPVAPRPSPSNFKIFKRDISNISVRKSTGRAPAYPFETLEVGGCFFVPNTEAKPDARKSLASTVSSAERRFAEETGETRTMKVGGVEKQVPVYKKTREFLLETANGDDYEQPGVTGALVTRIK